MNNSPGMDDRYGREPLLVQATIVPADSKERVIELGDVWAFVRRYGLRILLISLVAGAASLGASFMFHTIYRAEATVVPVAAKENAGGLGMIASQLGGVASLLGADLVGSNSTATALAQLKSRRLLMLFISEKNLLPVLFPEKWDRSKETWRVAPEDVPTLQDGFFQFSKNIFSVREDRKSGLLAVAVEWSEPQVAADWANEIIARTNEYLAKQAADEAGRNIDFLNKELSKADEIELRQAIFKLTETEIKKRMLARTQRDYAFRVLDPAIAPLTRRYVSPQRMLFFISGLALGAMLSAVWFMIVHVRASSPE